MPLSLDLYPIRRSFLRQHAGLKRQDVLPMVHDVSADAVEALSAHLERKSGPIGLIRSRLPRKQVVGCRVLRR